MQSNSEEALLLFLAWLESDDTFVAATALTLTLSGQQSRPDPASPVASWLLKISSLLQATYKL